MLKLVFLLLVGYHIIDNRMFMKIHSASFALAVVTLTFLMTRISDNSTRRHVSRLHITCVDFQMQRSMCPGLYLIMLLITGKLEINGLQSLLLHKKAESKKMISFALCSVFASLH